MKKWMKAVLLGAGVFAVVAGIAAIVCIAHYVGSTSVSETEKNTGGSPLKSPYSGEMVG